MDLNVIRREMKMRRARLPPEARVEAAQAFAQNLIEMLASQLLANDKGVQKIGVYHAHQGELDLSIAIAWLKKQGHTLYLPIIQNDTLVFGLFSSLDLLQANQYGIFEPNSDSKTTLQPLDLDIALLPLLAFDQNNNRLGTGKGYYDRAFQRQPHRDMPFLIGCGYAFQQVPTLTHQAHDIRMGAIISA